MEPQVLAALREWQEEIGVQLIGQLYIYYCTYTTKYNRFGSSVLSPTIYYGSYITCEEMKSYLRLGSKKGKKVRLVKVKDLKKYNWDPSAAGVLEKLIKSYAPESY